MKIIKNKYTQYTHSQYTQLVYIHCNCKLTNCYEIFCGFICYNQNDFTKLKVLSRYMVNFKKRVIRSFNSYMTSIIHICKSNHKWNFHFMFQISISETKSSIHMWNKSHTVWNLHFNSYMFNFNVWKKFTYMKFWIHIWNVLVWNKLNVKSLIHRRNFYTWNMFEINWNPQNYLKCSCVKSHNICSLIFKKCLPINEIRTELKVTN